MPEPIRSILTPAGPIIISSVVWPCMPGPFMPGIDCMCVSEVSCFICAIDVSDFTPVGACMTGIGAIPGICACVESCFAGICVWPVSALGIFIVLAGFFAATGFFAAALALFDVLLVAFFLAVAGFVFVVFVVEGFFFVDFSPIGMFIGIFDESAGCCC